MKISGGGEGSSRYVGGFLSEEDVKYATAIARLNDGGLSLYYLRTAQFPSKLLA
jgi:hypothetical protein